MELELDGAVILLTKHDWLDFERSAKKRIKPIQ